MAKETISFNELRRIKDSLPDGSIHKIAEELGLRVDTVRNYFGGANYEEGRGAGVHIEAGPEGGVVVIDDNTILNKARTLIGEEPVL